MTPWKFLQLYFIPLTVLLELYLGGWYTFLLPIICFVIRPVYSLSIKQRGDDHHEEHELNPSRAYRYIALSFVPVLLGVTLLAFWRTGNSTFAFIEITGLVLSVGTMNGIIGFTLAHEFIHRQNVVDRLAGHLLLLQNNYMHYSIEHIGGHHVYACTLKDPHTARINESFYRFLPRAIAYTFINAWEIAANRLKRKKNSVIGCRNSMLLFVALQLIVAVTSLVFAGWPATLFLLCQSMVAICLLHVTNYIQHYGLMRQELSPGKYEKVNEHHAWSSPGTGDTLSLFQLENHADHHMHPSRPYERLVQHDESPVQPAGYSGMLLLAFIPTIWFRIMNKRVNEFMLAGHS